MNVPWRGERVAVFDSKVDVHVPKIFASVTLDYVQLRRVWERSDPTRIIEARNVDHERVPLPFANGVTRPGRSRVRRVSAAIEIDLLDCTTSSSVRITSKSVSV